MDIPLPKRRRYLVIGVSPALVRFVEALIDRGVPKSDITVITDPERRPSAIERLSGVTITEVPPRSEILLNGAIRDADANICCVFSWYAVFSGHLVKSFEGLMLNAHFGELPRYRGGGGFSWQVLNGATSLGAYVHQLTSRVDAGPIICTETEEMETASPYPADFKRLAAVLGDRIAIRLAELLCATDVLAGCAQDEMAAEYYPKLTTTENAVVDFSWPVEQLDRFIRAFSDPYPGAMFSYRNENFRVARCSVLDRGVKRHPFCSGLIGNRSERGLHVLLADGVLAFEVITDYAGNLVDFRRFKIGDRLYTEDASRHRGMIFRPSSLNDDGN